MRANLPISTIPRVTVGASIASPRADACIGPYNHTKTHNNPKTASVLFIVQMPFLCVLLYCYFVPKIRSPASPRPGMM